MHFVWLLRWALFNKSMFLPSTQQHCNHQPNYGQNTAFPPTELVCNHFVPLTCKQTSDGVSLFLRRWPRVTLAASEWGCQPSAGMRPEFQSAPALTPGHSQNPGITLLWESFRSPAPLQHSILVGTSPGTFQKSAPWSLCSCHIIPPYVRLLR